MQDILEVKEITKFFGGLKALSEISFCVKKGETFGLIGPNGAGKTTLFNIITGNYKASSGSIHLEKERIDLLKPHKIIQKGIARTFQNIRLFSSMSVLENLLVAFYNHTNYTYFEAIFRFGRFFSEEKRIKNEALKILEYLKIEHLKDNLATSLSYGNQRKVEIARSLALKPKVLLLDEPAAGMNLAEKDELAEILEKIKREFDLTLILIEHDMKFVNRLCDRVLVLDYGKELFCGTPKEAITHKDVVAAYLGDVEDVKN